MCDKVEKSIARLAENTVSFILDYESKVDEIVKRFDKNCKSVIDEVKEFVKRAEDEAKQNAENAKASRSRARTKKKQTLSESSDTTTVETKPLATVLSSGKPKRMASQVASVMISKCAHLSENNKLRRPSGSDDLLAKYKLKAVEEIVIKQEKEEQEQILQAKHDTAESLLNTKESEISKTNENEMPPPAIPKKKGRTKKIKTEVDSSDTENESYRPVRSTRTKKNNNLQVPEQPIRTSRRKKKGDSDIVILPGEPIPVIDLLDSSIEEPNSTQEISEDIQKFSEKPQNITKIQSPERLDDKKRQKRDSITSEEEETKHAKKRTKKAPRAKTKKPEKISLISPKNIKREKSPLKDLPVNIETTKIADTTYQVLVEPPKIPVLNETFIPETVLNGTYCTNPLNATVTVEKIPTKILNSKLPVIEDLKTTTCSPIVNKVTEVFKTPEMVPQLRVSIETNPTVEKLIEEKAKSLEKDKQWQEPVEKPVVEPLLTDDDSDLSPTKQLHVTPKQTPQPLPSSSEKEDFPKKKKGVKTKPMFSPYANSPVKKRVAAFEKLGSADKNPPATTRVTRTKTKKLNEEKENEKTKIPPKPASKYVTPLANNKLKSLIPTSEQPVRTALQSANKQTEITQKSQSAVKLTRLEKIERVEKKEDDAQRKKLAILNAKIEESKRLREEKRLRAQQVREENEKQKEEKLRQALAEKEQKQREEAEKKKAHLAWKQRQEIEEQKKILEANRLQKQKEEEEEARRQQYKKYRAEREKKYKKPPPLPTPDDCDSDSSEGSSRPKVQFAEWAHKPKYMPVLDCMSDIPKNAIIKFFNIKPITPDLEQIFENIPKNLLKRNSSAVWRTPPRYSMLPK